MSSRTKRPRGGNPASKEFESLIAATGDWRAEALAHLRGLILRADPKVVEEIKWRKPSNPGGVPVWSHDGILCIGNVLKSSVRLTFPKGSQIADPKKLFNSRLDSRTVRAIDVHEAEVIDDEGLKALAREAVLLNSSGPPRK